MLLDTPGLNQFVIKVLLARTVSETYRIISETANQLFETPYSTIYIESEFGYSGVYSTIPKGSQSNGRRRDYMYKALQMKSPFVLPVEDVVQYHPEIKALKVRSVIYIPLSYEDTSIGVLTVLTLRIKKLNKKAIENLLLFGALASLAIRRSQSENETEQAVEMRDQFISLAAHELRTPLTAIHGYTQLLHKRFTNIQSKETNWIRELHGQTYRLIYIVNELLESSRVSSKKQKYLLQKLNAQKLVEKVISRYEIMHGARKYIMHSSLKEDECLMLGDSEKIDQLLSHLIDNAEKFSFDDTPIEIYLKCSKKHIIFKILNSGNPITSKDLLRVYDRFYKGENNLGGGIGLGLFLAQDIVRNHKGEISMRTVDKNKVEVKVRLPK